MGAAEEQITIDTDTLDPADAKPPKVMAHPPCSLCGLVHSVRRTLCWSCYKKLRVCGVALPPMLRTGRPRTTVPLVVAIVAVLSDEECASVQIALDQRMERAKGLRP